MQPARNKKNPLFCFPSILGLLVFMLVGCAGPLVQKDDTLTGYRRELAKLVEIGELTKDDAKKFYGIANLEVERRAKQHHQLSDPTVLPTGFVPPLRKAREL